MSAIGLIHFLLLWLTWKCLWFSIINSNAYWTLVPFIISILLLLHNKATRLRIHTVIVPRSDEFKRASIKSTTLQHKTEMKQGGRKGLFVIEHSFIRESEKANRRDGTICHDSCLSITYFLWEDCDAEADLHKCIMAVSARARGTCLA